MITKEDRNIIIQPNSIKTKTIAHIYINDDKISINFPEKNRKFNTLVNLLGYRWDRDNKIHSRTLTPYTGSVIDRTAELGHKLLAGGFSVVFPNKQIQDRAIAGEYESECRRWVHARTNGKYKDWFVIRWVWPDNYYYSARRITGSRYDKPCVVVPPEQFAEVIDFAEINKFRFTEGALKLVEQTKKMIDTALIVSITIQKDDVNYPLNLPAVDWNEDDLEDDIKFDDTSNSTS